MSNGEEPPLRPATFQVAGEPWSLVFAPHPSAMKEQGIWLFDQKTGEFWELIANTNFVLRPRKGTAPSKRRLKR